MSNEATEYRNHVAEKAKQLIALMEEAAQKDVAVAKLLRAMRADLELLSRGDESLPTRLLRGWSWYFLWENPDRIDRKYPSLINCYAELSTLSDHLNMESYLKSKAYLDSL